VAARFRGERKWAYPKLVALAREIRERIGPDERIYLTGKRVNLLPLLFALDIPVV
jgi:hypothetical protein